MKKCIQLTALFILMVTQTGCIQKEIIDDVNIILASGYDSSGGELTGTVVVPVYQKQQPVKSEILEEQAVLTRDLLTNLQRKSSDPLVYGKLQVALFGEELAKKGFKDLLDSLQRDASVGSRVYLAVGRKSASEILRGQYGIRGTAVYLSNLIRHNIESRDLSRENLHLFLYNMYDKGKDAYLPILELSGKDELEISGVALFDEDRMVAEVPSDKMIFFKLLTDQYMEGTYTMALKDGVKVSVKSITSHKKVRMKSEDSVKIDIKLEGHIREYTGKKITPAVVKKVESEFKKTVEKECLALIEQFQSLDIDPVGIGDQASHTFRGFKIKEWKKNYRNVKADVNADIIVNESGVID
ncbi:Ger(x)C family spore germination protein [Bacillus sp. FJAT-42376]|uniref:Ger(x)C family spore germination protein n=1 Tax=Bacillus sp. FJAT-42376 TaxID=2014076 RepID=UPI000F4E884D|nr:Ger(x)C family spore germination protein [Bacillus sp. FJAT-42376]AZB42566.1 Ger(x)C family spore germination protein [Bacillus sp. FJAT-42376]